jgi:myosin heavy subunit
LPSASASPQDHLPGAFLPHRITQTQIFDLDASKDYLEVHPNSLVACENMVKMAELSEAAILHNLRLRYKENQIYVRQHSLSLAHPR